MHDQRVAERIVLWMKDATLREAGAGAAAVVVRDLSVTGFRAEWHYPLRPGTRVWLKLGKLEALCASVAWWRSPEIGCRFDQAIHPAVFARIVALQASGQNAMAARGR